MPSRNWRRFAVCAVVAAAIAATGYAGYSWWTRPRPTPPTEIFRGIVYTCEEMNAEECRGLMCLVRVDLAAPGIGLYLTPLDPGAVSRGYQYRLAEATTALRRENLAVVINGTFFSAESGLFYRTGDLANSVQTVIADGEVSHVDPNSYMLWFGTDLTPHIEFRSPPDDGLLRSVRWGIGAGAVSLWKGQVRQSAVGHEMDRRTAVGIDSSQRLLWLAVFENASSSAVARVLGERGAQDGFLLDGGHSTVMVLGPQAAHLRSGVLLGGLRPVATCFGIRAEPL
ncbi:MAG: phosphodiester glycosidase family protein [Thermoguttaceae bacterium]